MHARDLSRDTNQGSTEQHEGRGSWLGAGQVGGYCLPPVTRAVSPSSPGKARAGWDKKQGVQGGGANGQQGTGEVEGTPFSASEAVTTATRGYADQERSPFVSSVYQ